MSLEIEIRSNSKQAEASLKNLLKTIDQIPASVQKGNAEMASFSKDVSKDLKAINKNVEQSSKTVERSLKSFANFAKITSGLITGLLAAGGISSLSSQFTELNNRIALTTGRTKQLVVQQQKLFAIARRSNVDLKTTVDLYSSLVVNAQRSRKEATLLTEILIKAGKVGGGPAETIALSLVQLQQGLASGVLRGEELNSVLEGTPRIAQAIAKELGTTIGELRRLAAEGRISSEVVATALINAKDDIEAEFATLKIPFNQIIANSGREIGISLNRLFSTVSSTLGTIFGGGDFIGSLTSAITNALSDLSVFIRGIQTEIILLKVEFGSVGNFVRRSFRNMVDGVVSYASVLFTAIDKVKDFAKGVGKIFYDLYIEVVGNSTWPDLVDGVIDYASFLDKAYLKVVAFSNKVKSSFSNLASFVKNALVLPSLGGFESMLSSLKSNVTKFINQVSALTINGITAALGAAITAAFTIAVLSGGFAGGLGAKVATAFIGAVGAYLIGFAKNFDVDRASTFGPITEILQNQENVLFTIADGIGALVSGAGSFTTGKLETAIDFLSENIVAVAAALPILSGALKGLTGGRAGSILNPLGGVRQSLGQTLGDINQSRIAGGFIRGLEAETKNLEAELSALKESIKGQKLRLESELRGLGANTARAKAIRAELNSLDQRESVETGKLISEIQKNQKKLQINSQLLTGPVSRLRDAVSLAVVGFGRLGGSLGGIAGGLGGAVFGEEAARIFGLNSAQSMVAVILSAQLGQVIAGALLQVLFQSFATLVQLLVSGLLGVIPLLITGITAAFAKGVVLFRAALLSAMITFGPIIQTAMRLGAVAGAATLRLALIAGSIAGGAILAAATFIAANAIPLAIGAALTGLVAYAFSDESIFNKAGKWLGNAIFDGIVWIKDLGTQIAEAIGDGLEGIKDRFVGFFGFGGSETPIKRASGGSVFGAGSATSDSIPAMLSNGEFVVKTSVANKYRELLEYLNATGQLPGYALGGLVSPPSNYKREESIADITKLFGNVKTYDNLQKQVKSVTTKESLIQLVKDFVDNEIILDSKRTGVSTGMYNKVYNDDLWTSSYSPISGDDEFKTKFSPKVNIPQLNPSDTWEQLYMKAAITAHEIEHMREINRRLVASMGQESLAEEQKSVFDWAAISGNNIFKETNAAGTMFRESSANAGALLSLDNLVDASGNPITDNFNYRKAIGISELNYAVTQPYQHLSASKDVFKSTSDVGNWISSVDGGFALDYLNDFNLNKNGNASDPSVMGMSLNPVFEAISKLSVLSNLQKTKGFDLSTEQGVEDYQMFMQASALFGKEYQNQYGKLNQHIQGLDGFATGGSVSGPGTGTSDDILAKLSNGEFVVKTSVANKHRGLLEHLNSTGKLPGFNTGGSVGSSSGSGDGFFSGAISSIGDLFNEMIEMLKEFIGAENVAKLTKAFDGLKNAFGFGEGSKNSPSAITDFSGLAQAIAKALPSENLNLADLTKAFEKDARLTSRVLSLNEQRTKVQQEIKDLQARNEAVPLELLTQLKLIDQDLVTETGKVAEILNKQLEQNERQIQAIQEMATSRLGDFKGDVQGGLSGLLKGEIGLEEFGKGILTSFTDNVLESVAGGITTGIFQTEDGEASGFASTIESLFGDLGMLGFGVGETVEGGLSAGIGAAGDLIGKTAGSPMFVKIVDSLTMGAEDKAFLDTEATDFTEITNGGITGEGVEGQEEANEGFLGGLRGVFDQFLPGISGIFDSLSGSLGGIFDGLLGSLGGLFGGGGGGGLGGVLSLFGGFFNDGGLVPGGGPQPVIAHGGEMILNKRQQGHLFNQLDKNRAGGGSTVNQTIQITGDISRQTKKEIYGMMPQIAAGVNQNNIEQNR